VLFVDEARFSARSAMVYVLGPVLKATTWWRKQTIATPEAFW